MVRLPENADCIKINVILKDGAKILNKDITNQPLGEHGNVVSFWRDEKTVECYPIEQVECFQFVFEDGKS